MLGSRKKISEPERIMLLFLLRADEFYILTRYCDRTFFQYMTFRMAHHALEYYLKASLLVFFGLEEMKKLGHDLETLWEEYKKCLPEVEIESRVIEHINRFETMRYPEGSKFVCTLWGVSYNELFSEVFDGVEKKNQKTLACFSLQDFDKLVFTLRGSLPQGHQLPIITAPGGDKEKYLFMDNKFFSKEENNKKLSEA